MTAAGPEPADAAVPVGIRLQGLVSSVSSVVAPLTLISTLLFYFGYASSRAQYRYFGVDVDTIGLSTQDFVMRSPQPLLVPLLVLGAAGAFVAAAHTTVRRHLDGAAEWPSRLVRWRRVAIWGSWAGRALLLTGIVLLCIYGYLRDWPWYPVVTPLVLVLGSGVAAYAMKLDGLLGRSGRSRRTAVVSLYAVLATSLFWATAMLAELAGRGLALEEAAHLDRLPSVILDTRERLYLTSGNVSETVLPTAPDQQFHYRYRQLQLLIQGRDRLFLVPTAWSPSDSTLVVTLTGDVRVQFRFES